jgi:hypothetical protein
MSTREVNHIFQSLRLGLVPERGIDAFAEGTERPRGELRRQLDLAKSGEGTIKFLRGGYGCGKTFMSRVAVLDAQTENFATSFVVVSDNDLHFHRFEDVYRKVMTELGTASCPRGALGDILDRWIGRIEAKMMAAGADPDAPDFDAKVRGRLNEDLAALSGGQVPQDFVRVIQTIFDLKQRGETNDAGALISWLCGSTNVAASVKRLAGIRGEIGSKDALDYLRGVLVIVRQAGYAGLLIVIDEAETILRMRTDVRHKSLNGIRQIADAAGGYPGLVWLFTGTPDFYDSRQGVAGLPPLHDRIHFMKQGAHVSLRQAQLVLEPFNEKRLRAVALRLRDIYPAKDRLRFERLVNDAFIERLVAEVTTGFKRDVGVVPRQFLRALVTEMDLVDEREDEGDGYDPGRDYQFTAGPMTPQEEQAVTGAAVPPSVVEDELVPEEDVW